MSVGGLVGALLTGAVVERLRMQHKQQLVWPAVAVSVHVTERDRRRPQKSDAPTRKVLCRKLLTTNDVAVHRKFRCPRQSGQSVVTCSGAAFAR